MTTSKLYLVFTCLTIFSLPLSQMVFTHLDLPDLCITLYWAILGCCCLFNLKKSLEVRQKNILLRGTQFYNLSTGSFALFTSSMAGISYLI